MSLALLAMLLALLPSCSDRADQTTAAKALKAIQEDQQKINQKYNQAFATAKTDEEREKLSKARRKEIQERVRRALQVAKDHPHDPAAFDARVWILTGGLSYVEETWQALDQIREHELANPKLGVVCEAAVIYRFSYAGTEDFLRSVMRNNPDHTVQGLAVYTLAIVLRDYSRVSEALKDPEKAKRWDDLPPELSQKLRTSEPEKLRREAEELYERAADRYGDVKTPYSDRTLRSRAESGLFELRYLRVGKVAPEIEGEDTEGCKFRLSDYRGKVVVLDFWGNW
jgi:tetratricopeptide (TPR) repeat protein